VKGREGTPGNEKADVLGGKAAEKPGYSRVMSIAHLKIQISGKLRKAKTAWHDTPSHHGTEEVLPPQEILLGQDAECAGSYSGTNPRRKFEVRSIPQADPQDGGR
jgi:hypothetical protein